MNRDTIDNYDSETSAISPDYSRYSKGTINMLDDINMIDDLVKDVGELKHDYYKSKRLLNKAISMMILMFLLNTILLIYLIINLKITNPVFIVVSIVISIAILINMSLIINYKN